MENKHIKRGSTEYVIRGFLIKTTMRYHYIPIRMAKIQNTDSSKCRQVCGEQELPFIAVGNVK